MPVAPFAARPAGTRPQSERVDDTSDMFLFQAPGPRAREHKEQREPLSLLYRKVAGSVKHNASIRPNADALTRNRTCLNPQPSTLKPKL
jgi:hypothetical protein